MIPDPEPPRRRLLSPDVLVPAGFVLALLTWLYWVNQAHPPMTAFVLEYLR